MTLTTVEGKKEFKNKLCIVNTVNRCKIKMHQTVLIILSSKQYKQLPNLLEISVKYLCECVSFHDLCYFNNYVLGQQDM